MALIRIAGPSVEPVSVDEVKAHLHIDYDDDDEIIGGYIKAARKKLEHRCGRSFVQQTWEYRIEAFESQIEIPILPVIEVVQITYIDEDGADQTVDDGEYAFIDAGESERSSVLLTGTWPSDVFDRPDAVRVQFKSGYAPDAVTPPAEPDYAGNVPDDIKQAMRWLVGHMIENKESVILTPTRQEFQEVPDSVETIIGPYIVPRL